MTTLCGTPVQMFGCKGKGGNSESDKENWKRRTVVSDTPFPPLFVMLLLLEVIHTATADARNPY